MASHRSDDLSDFLRARGVRKKTAKRIGALDGNRRRSGAKGEKMAKQAVEDLGEAVEAIRERVLAGDPKRRAAARKAGSTRQRTATKRRASSKQAATTRAKAAKATSTKRRASARKAATTRAKVTKARTGS